MKKTRISLVVLAIACLILVTISACDGFGLSVQGPHSITQAYLRDTIFSVEPRLNGSVTVWMTHDDIGFYCTTDQSIKQQALAIIEDIDQAPSVLITYRSVNINDPEVNGIGAGGCAVEKTSGESSTQQAYKLLSIIRVSP